MRWHLRKIALIMLFGMLAPGIRAQTVIDSLQKELDKPGLSDSMRMEVLLSLGWNYSFLHRDSAMEVLNTCFALAEKSNNFRVMGDAYSYMGTSYYREDEYDSALVFYQKAEQCFLRDTAADAGVNVAVNRMSMGTMALQRGRHQTALGYYLQAIDSLENGTGEKDWSNLITAYANIGLVYNDLKQYDKALDYHGKALELCHRYDPAIEKTAQIQMFVAIDWLNLKKYERAFESLKKADTLVRRIHTDYMYAIFYGIQGRCYSGIGSYAASIASFRQALDYARKGKQRFQEANALQQIGIVYFETNNDAESIRYLLSSVSMSREIGDKVREETSLKYLARAYARSASLREALKYYQQYVALNDSISESDSRNQIIDMENRYQSQKRQDSILVLKKNNQLQVLALHRKESRNWAVIVGAGLLLLIALLVYINLENRNRLLRQRDKLHAQRIHELEKERQLVAVQSVLKGQEEERSRLARDLHDGVGGLLSGVKLSLSIMKGNVFLSESNALTVNNVITQLDQSIAELRRVSHNMMPEALIKFGLKEAMENYCENLNLSNRIKVRLQTYGMDRRLEQSTEIILYRIVQELLTNVIKHADADHALIQLIREEDSFSLTVEDDGKGFPAGNQHLERGAGLANVRARVDYIGGKVDVRSAPGDGTSVNIVGPL